MIVGAIASMLEVDPSLAAGDVRQVVRDTAFGDTDGLATDRHLGLL